MVDDYVNRKHGLTKVEYLLPELEELTAETLGVIVYQDQVLQIANRLAGYSLGEADLLRRAMGKKKPEEMAKQRERFVRGRAAARHRREEGRAGLRADGGVRGLRLREVALDRLRADHLPDRLPEGEPPARVPGGAAHRSRRATTTSSRATSRTRSSAGSRCCAPDVNESARDFTVVRGGHPLRPRGREERRRGRDRGDPRGARRAGRFASLFDFAARVDAPAREPARGREPGASAARSTRCTPSRAAVWAALDAALEAGAAAQRDREIGQASLFGGAGARRARARAAARRAALDRPAAARAREGGARLLRHGPPARGASAPSSRASPT